MRRAALVLACVAIAPAARAQEPAAPPGPESPAPGTQEPSAPAAQAPAGQEPSAAIEESHATRGPITGAVRAGLYTDSDQTTVFRALGALGGSVGRWTVNGNVSVDVVSSSSVDVRSSPGLSKVDVTTSASGRSSTSGGNMSDRRLAGTLSGGWNDSRGHTFGFSASYANERDYNSVGGGLNGSIDLLERTTTLLAGVNFTYNWIASVLDPTFAEQMYELGWSAGLAQVVSRNDALRLRYDGSVAHGYLGSPYRNVRFGDWTPELGADGRILFANTIGSADGRPETLPSLRVRHALVLEWVHSLRDGLALFAQARPGLDDWGIESLTAAAELRAATTWWRVRLGYRFYIQSGADFYRSKYVMDATSYTYFTSDKELSRELGHVVNLGISRVIKQPKSSRDSRVLLDLALNVLYYQYPDFVLLPSRTSGFVDLGLTFEP